MPERYNGCRSVRRAVSLDGSKDREKNLGRGFNFESLGHSRGYLYSFYKSRVYVIAYNQQIYLTKLSVTIGHSVFHHQATFGVSI